MKKNRKKIKLVTSQAIEKKRKKIIHNKFRVLNKAMREVVDLLKLIFPSSTAELNSK